MKILITGSNGLLGQKLVAYIEEKGYDYVATSKGENRNSKCPVERYRSMDITVEQQVESVLTEEKPTHVIHTAALTNVDLCETDPELCERMNVTATSYLINACNKIKAHFQLLSTDFIFDGKKGNYKEDDEPNPLSEYATSKLKAENLVKSLCEVEWSIVRTIILYGTGENLTRSNIIVWAKGALEKGGELSIVDDQFRAPTWAEDLAVGCMSILEHGETGVFHLSGPETMSIYTIIVRIAEHFGYDYSRVSKISSDTLNQAAKRPPKTGFDLSKAYSKIHYRPHTLEETLSIIFEE